MDDDMAGPFVSIDAVADPHGFAGLWLDLLGSLYDEPNHTELSRSSWQMFPAIKGLSWNLTWMDHL